MIVMPFTIYQLRHFLVNLGYNCYDKAKYCNEAKTNTSKEINGFKQNFQELQCLRNTLLREAV